LSTAEQQSLSLKERLEIESRLANYHIPIQILQIVAEECNCGKLVSGEMEVRGRSNKHSLIISSLNDQSLIQLKQIFLDCEDSSSRFRFAVLLSSKFPPVTFKFVMAKKLQGKSGQEYIFDVCIFSRATEELVAVGMQNNDTNKGAADAKLLHKFHSIISDILPVNSGMRSAYYSSSYGYDCNPLHLATKKRQAEVGSYNTEIYFLEFRDGVYREIRE
jgi:hypothetical protein